MTRTFCLVATAIGCAACGIVRTSGTGCRNDIAPTGATIVATGAFTPGTGSVSGNVTIYSLGSGSYEAFLNSFSSPSNIAGLLFVVKDSTGTQALNTSLLSSCGNQAYVFEDSGSVTFVQATIHQPSPPEDLNQATLSTAQ